MGIAAPAFGLDTDQVLLVLVRWLAVGGLLSSFGSLLFLAGPSRPGTPAAQRRVRRLAGSSLVAAALGLLGWAGLESATLADAANAGEALAAIPKVLSGTVFGHLVAWQALAVVAAAVCHVRRWAWLAASAAGAAVALEAGHLHAWAMLPGPSILLASETLHLLAAGAWLGGVLPLLIVVRAAPPAEAAVASRQFSPLATAAVLVLTATALCQGWELSGGWAGLAGTAYGWMELSKLALFLGLLVCAALNRFRFTPALAGAGPTGARRALARSIAIETALGLLVVLAATVLTGLEPGMHLQPVWPFPVRPSLDIVNADPEFRREVANAVLAMVGALALVGLGIVVRWLRWVAWPVAAVIAWFALPHFDLLFVQAYPTSFYRAPTAFAADSIADGAALYPRHCAGCHGAEGRGDGPVGKGLRVPPADLTADHLREHTDGELFWWLSHGIVSAEGEVAMPGFSGMLSDDEIWHLIDYVRANNAGLARRATGLWSSPLKAPGFDATCVGGRTLTMADLRGRVVRLTFGAAAAALPADAPAVTILVSVPGVDVPGVDVPGDQCSTNDPAIAHAYSIAAGVPSGMRAGTQIIVDANGWLRELLPPEQAGRAADEVRRVARAPLRVGTASRHMHRH